MRDVIDLSEYTDYFVKETITNPLVSVIVPAYNVQDFLVDCLGSLVKQTFRDFEIVVVDDGSTDSTPEILKKFKEADSRIKVITQKNGGLSCARNTGMSNSNGQYITFLDSDDWVSENYITELYNAITQNNCDIAVAEMIRKRPNSQKYRLHFKEKTVFSSLEDKICACRIPTLCYVCGKLFKKELIENSPFKLGVYFEDVIWIPEIVKKSENLVVVPNVVYYYRVNSTSIVKTAQSLEKQHDSYIAKKYIANFFEQNSLKLKNKNKKITKYIKYFLGYPISRIKEYKNREIEYLFDLIPISLKKSGDYYKFKKIKKFFGIKKLDSHIYLNLFGIHMGFKVKEKFDYQEVTSFGLTQEKRSTKIIVSLTSFPDRINQIHKTISTLLNQTIQPDRLILWLSEDQFINKENDLPKNLLDLKEYGLEIRWCENLRSYRKLVPTLKEFPNDIIVTADDDLYYQKDWLESLYNAYLKKPNYIYSRRACRLEKDGIKIKLISHYNNFDTEPSYCNQLMGGAGTLYPPHSLNDEVFNIENIKTLIPTHDDVYFWAMALLNKTKIALVENKDLNLYIVEDTQQSGLCKINNSKSGSISGEEAFNKIFEKYPNLTKLLKGNE